jgi:large subunit ribosomal protein MRP49
MLVNRTHNQEGPATLTLYFREPGATLKSDVPQPSSSTEGLCKAPPAAEGERAVTIDMKNRRSEAILKEFMDKSGAVAVKPTPQDEMMMREVEEREAQGEIDRVRIRKMNDEAKREKEMLAQAHSEAAAIRAAV